MTQQAILFSDPMHAPIARKRDPETSRQAAKAITESGARKNQQNTILNAIKSYPGRTSYELTRCCPLDRYQVARRCAELEQAGLIRKSLPRECQITGRNAHTWEAI